MIAKKIAQKLEENRRHLLAMVSERCWNKLSKKHYFIISEIKDEAGENASIHRPKRKQKKDKKQLLSFEQAVEQLALIYHNLYDVNLYIYQARRCSTIIEIRYYPKSLLEHDYLKVVKDHEPMFHAKLVIPPYVESDTEQFDVNWALGTWWHAWKWFWWRKSFR